MPRKKARSRKKRLSQWEKAALEREKRTAEDAANVRPVLEKHKDWRFLRDSKEDWLAHYDERKKAIARSARRAVQALYPQYRIKARQGRGTAHHWVYVNIVVPDLDHYSDEADAIASRARDMLRNIGIPFAEYYSDCGPGSDIPGTCLHVETNSYSYECG